MSNYVMTWVWKNSAVQDPSCLLVLLSLADQANDEGYCWPSIRSTASRCRISERQVQRWIRHLEYQGILEVQERGGTSSMYRIVGGDTSVTGGVSSASPEGCHPRHPNHKEPSENQVRCPYCKRITGSDGKHSCPAMNQLVR